VQFGELLRAELRDAVTGVTRSPPDVADYFLSLDSPPPLLIVGEPRAGKAVLALHLLLTC